MSLPRDREKPRPEEKRTIEQNNALMREYVRFLAQVEREARASEQAQRRAYRP